jgi:outer membrane lipoprotein-sorting protein
MTTFRLAILAVALCVLISPALADAKSEAILKEMARRSTNLTTFSATMEFKHDIFVEKIRYFFHRPDKCRMEIDDGIGTKIMIVNGDRSAIVESGAATMVPREILKDVLSESGGLSLGNVGSLIGEIAKSTCVTQKMLDETTVVDVIDVVGKKEGNSARLYIDNNGQIRKIAVRTKNMVETILITDPIADDKFLIPEKK